MNRICATIKYLTVYGVAAQLVPLLYELMRDLLIEKLRLAVTTVFDFTRPLGVFHEKKIVFWLPSIIDTIYGNA